MQFQCCPSSFILTILTYKYASWIQIHICLGIWHLNSVLHCQIVGFYHFSYSSGQYKTVPITRRPLVPRFINSRGSIGMISKWESWIWVRFCAFFASRVKNTLVGRDFIVVKFCKIEKTQNLAKFQLA